MNALAIDTATNALGLCLSSGSGLRTVVLQVGLKHSEKLMPAIRSLLEEADIPVQELDLVVCSTGPGSFTGIRIGLATAKGLAAGVRPAGVPGSRGTGSRGTAVRLIGVSTLDGLFHRYRRFPGTVVAVNPSLRKKYYAGIYGEGGLDGDYLETTLPDLCALLETRRPLLITGAAAAELYELIPGAGAAGQKGRRRPEIVVDDSLQPSDPAGLLACGLQRLEEPAAEPQPLYLRKSEAEITFFGE